MLTQNKGENVMYRSNVLVCGGTGCSSSNSQEIMRRLEEEIKKKANVCGFTPTDASAA